MEDIIYVFILVCAFISAYLTTVTIYCGLTVLLKATKNFVIRWLLYAASFVLLSITAGSIIDLYHFNITTMVVLRILAFLYASWHFYFVLRHKIIVDYEQKFQFLPSLKKDYVELLKARERRNDRKAPFITCWCSEQKIYRALIVIEAGSFEASADKEDTAIQWAARFALQYTK